MSQVSDTYDGTNPPDLTRRLTMRRRAITDDTQLGQIIARLEEDNRDRNVKNARIMAKYNAERPHRPHELRAEGLGWKSNFSSQPLSTLIERISPRFVRALSGVKYLTSAQLPDTVPGASEKSEIFRREFTELCRRRPDWRSFVADVSQENALFGYCAAGYTNEFDWFPRFFRQDEFFVPSGTKQDAKSCPLFVAKETVFPHELFAYVEDREAAEIAGWDIDAVVESINKAQPPSVGSSSTSMDARKYEDLARESNIAQSLARGARVIEMYHVFVTEVTGKVSHYIWDNRVSLRLFAREDQFDHMGDAVQFFSFQQANGLLMGSKGVGRTVYNLAAIVDRARNEVMDRLQMSGKIILQGDDNDIRRFKMSVVGQSILISKNLSVVQNKLEAGVEPFIALDNWTQRLMDEIAGNISPGGVMDQLQGERVTNGQVNLLADLNNEMKDVKIERFVLQFADLLSVMQRRAASPRVSEEDARQFRARCLRYMSREELETLADQPVAETIEDLSNFDRQMIINVTTELNGDPRVDQKKILQKRLTALVDAEFAKDVILPEEDPTVAVEQARLQLLENDLITKGQRPGVSPRDNFAVHMDTLLEFAQQVAEAVAENIDNALIMKGVLEHGLEHVQVAVNSGVDKELVKQYQEALMNIHKGLQQIAEQAQLEASQASSSDAQIA